MRCETCSVRINQFVAQATGMSRRTADSAIADGRVLINSETANLGDSVEPGDTVTLNGKKIVPQEPLTIMLNKPVGYVCSRDGQGSKTIYELLPKELHRLKPVGRLDKDSSGLLVMTNDGELANKLTHPKFQKIKVYEISLDKALSNTAANKIEQGVELEDGLSKLQLKGYEREWTVTMGEGRNRQIRRTFGALGYEVKQLHRTQLGTYNLGALTSGKFEYFKI